MRNLILILIYCISLNLVSIQSAGATSVIIADTVSQFKFAAIDEIPNGPKPITQNSNCDYYTLDKEVRWHPVTESIADKGWAILSEVEFAQYLLIGFAGKMESSTSGSCFISESNIAIYEKDILVGVLYLNESTQSDIGSMRLMDGGFVRVFSGDLIQIPSAEITLGYNKLYVQPVSKFTAYCNGRSIVPNIIGQNILEGRSILFNLGFSPVTRNDPDVISWRQYLLNEGISEVDGCSGTGFAFCAFDYENEGSNLTVVTAGEDDYPEIVRTMIECKS